MPYRVLKDVSCQTVDDEPILHQAGTVISEWEVSQFVKEKIVQGSLHYRSLFEPLTEKQAFDHRSKETAIEGDHLVDGHWVSAPWDDYVGLHPAEVINRMGESSDRDKIQQARLYEKGGLNRQSILDYVAPAEREPFYGYDDMPVREVLEKLEVLPDKSVQEVLTYETANRRRPAIVSYERPSSEEASGDADAESKTPEEVVT